MKRRPALRWFLAALVLFPVLESCRQAPRVKPSREAARAGAAGEKKGPGKLVILHINDFHGQVFPVRATWAPRRDWKNGQPPLQGGAAAVAAYVKRVRAAAALSGAAVLFLDTGDWFQGTPEGNETKGRIVMEWFTRMGLEATVVGNHDFDYGWTNLVALVHSVKFPVLAANILPPGTDPEKALKGPEPPKPADGLRPYWVKRVRGVRILFFGLILKDTPKVTAGPLGGVEFAGEEKTFRAWLPRLRAEGDQFVLMTHDGVQIDKSLAKRLQDVKRLKIILGGHSHTRLSRPIHEGHIRIFQTHGKGTEVDHIEYRVLPSKKEIEFIRSRVVDLRLDSVGQDPETKAWLAERTRAIREKWDRPVGVLSAALRRTRAPRSSSAGNLAADVTRLAAKADIGFANKGGLRCNLPKGKVTRRDIFQFIPFDNTIVVMPLRGSEIRKALDIFFHTGRSALEVSGILVHHKGRKVTRVTLPDGTPLDPRAVYKVAMNSYLAGPGDKSGIFRSNPRKRDTGVKLRSALLKYIKKNPVTKVPTENRYIKD